MKNLLKNYVEEFNRTDDELYVNDIPNAKAYEWLEDRIPLFECPDKQLEKTYYFRWWTYRKHIMTTSGGQGVSEFMPHVPWVKNKYNICGGAAHHHFYEGRWLRNSNDIFSFYLRCFLDDPATAHQYSSWLLNSAEEYEKVGGDLSIGKRELDQMIEYYGEWERTHGHSSGMFWSLDGYDAMEYSISGIRNGKSVKGIRPTLNSYMYAEALAIAYFAKKIGENETAVAYEQKAEKLKKLINENLLFDGFYKAKHGECDDELEEILEKPGDTGSPKELIGYIPYMFGIPEEGLENCFNYLNDPNIFLAKTGMTTADRSHPDYLKEYKHECLWNGYVWPFATAQTLTGLIKTIHSGHPELKSIFIKHMLLYANSHIIEKDGKILPWIDEVMSPDEYKWTAREILEARGWPHGRERGKDYNHSTFCDLVITGIVGVRTDSDELSVDPAIPPEWDYMKMENIRYRDHLYTVIYDKTGEKYGMGKDIIILKK